MAATQAFVWTGHQVVYRRVSSDGRKRYTMYVVLGAELWEGQCQSIVLLTDIDIFISEAD